MNFNNYISALDSVFITVFSVVMGLYFGLINDIKAIFGKESFFTNNSLIILFFVYIIILFIGYMFIINLREAMLENDNSKYKEIFIVFLLVTISLGTLLVRARNNNMEFNFLVFFAITLFIWCLVSLFLANLASKNEVKKNV